MIKEAELKNYRKEVERSLACSRPAKKSILNNLQSDMEEYLAEHPDADMEQLRQRFGSPASYTKESAASMDEQELCKTVSTNKFRKRVILVVAAIVILIVAIASFEIAYRNYKSAGAGHTIIITEET